MAKIHAAGPGKLHDGGGLYCIKATKDTGSWAYRWDGAKWMGLGSTATVDLAQARAKAAQCRELRAQGLDPREKRNADRAEIKIAAAKATSFKTAVERYATLPRTGQAGATP